MVKFRHNVSKIGFDIDGTLFDNTVRKTYLELGNMDKFLSESIHDPIVPDVFKLFKRTWEYSIGRYPDLPPVFLITSRHISQFRITMDLLRNHGIHFDADQLVMSKEVIRSEEEEIPYKIARIRELGSFTSYFDNNPKVVARVNEEFPDTTAVRVGVYDPSFGSKFYSAIKEGS